MKYFITIVVYLSFRFITADLNSTTARSKHNRRDSNMMSLIQGIQLQLDSLENEGGRQASRVQEILRSTTRLESQRQEFVGILDRSETHLSQKIEDTRGEVKRILTFQDILREEIDKIQQAQLINKIWIQDQLQNANRMGSNSDLNSSSNNDVLSNLQVIQSTLQGLRRMFDTLQSTIMTVKSNVTHLTNMTNWILNFEKEMLVTKGYLQMSLQTAMDDKRYSLSTQSLYDPSIHKVEIEKLPKDCAEVQMKVAKRSGLYRIRLQYAALPLLVFCDMDTDNGGWMVIQRRKDGAVSFLREWQEYKYGFGNIAGEFWIGNENLYLVTHQDLYELRVDLEDLEDQKSFAVYDGLAVGSEREKYMLKLLGPLSAGNAGDGLTYHASASFSTLDVDNDGHCVHTGGWWHNQCDVTNLNGRYINPQEYQGTYWHGPSNSLKATTMMIRPLRPKIIDQKSATPFGDFKSTGPLNIDF